jgi:hypothetical protein
MSGEVELKRRDSEVSHAVMNNTRIRNHVTVVTVLDLAHA